MEITIKRLEQEKNYIREYTLSNPFSSLLNRFMNEFKNSYVYNTNAIEGNSITEYDTAYIIQSNTFLEGYSAKDNMEVFGSSKAWDYVLEQPDFTIDTILQIHKYILFFDVDHVGVFRNIPVYIGSKQMLPVEMIQESMNRFIDKLAIKKRNIYAYCRNSFNV